MKLSTQELQAAFKIVNQVDVQPGLLSSQFVRITSRANKVQLALTGLCISEATCPVLDRPIDFTWYIDRRVVQAFLTAIKAKTVTIDPQKDVLLWKAGRQKITAAAVSTAIGYSHWDPVKAVDLKLTKDLQKEIALHAQYAPTTADADHLSAVCLQKGYGLIASDSFVVSTTLRKDQPQSVKLPVLLAKALDGTAKSIFIEKGGAGITYQQGYLYQPLFANCITSYPLKSLTKVIAGQVPVKAVIKVQAKPFADTLVQLRNYVFGTMTGLTVVCTQAKTPGYVLLSLDVQQGKVESAMPAVLSTDFRYVWQLAKLCPWVEYIAGVDPDAMISCGQKDGCHAFSAGKRVLIVAETA